MIIKNVVSVSGGKDSAATLSIAIQERGRENVIAIFCDTGNEHEQTYAYLDYIEQFFGIKIVRLKADFAQQIQNKRMFIARDQRTGRDKSGRKIRWSNKAKRRALAALHPTGNPFFDLCLWKGRFPSRKAQFCTEELKRNIAVGYQIDLIDQGYKVISWQGVRRDESLNRANAKKIERVGPDLYIFRPIVEWTAEQVFSHCKTIGLQPNPLYLQGMGRVGCMPCINVSKSELSEINNRFSEHIQRIADWEIQVGNCSKRGFSTFASDTHNAKDRREIFKDLNIWARVEWSKTSHGGKQYDMFKVSGYPEKCSSAYGLCD